MYLHLPSIRLSDVPRILQIRKTHRIIQRTLCNGIEVDIPPVEERLAHDPPFFQQTDHDGGTVVVPVVLECPLVGGDVEICCFGAQAFGLEG